MIEVVSPGAPMRRSRIPVRVTIQSSEVASCCDNSALVRMRSGTYEATAVTAARVTAMLGCSGMHESRGDAESYASRRSIWPQEGCVFHDYISPHASLNSPPYGNRSNRWCPCRVRSSDCRTIDDQYRHGRC